ncbi:DUF5337 domain-containing protein [Pararhodobacter aggregans]|uniref:DUF5337 domain-containing protein n=1 Tax=Pararhodobacter aggregans TaxID=404875 RepID=A0A2T7UL36_9RHOB|nr:DUF5337 domain-containing protein [Pararhodobacter aggregans]PTX05400.1 hypothetical protein C8N33_101819 [Pararhodobacter aggregans]PVE45358.1 hypothetical protein DDE23_21430 [Pararhodobacter aggregans]
MDREPDQAKRGRVISLVIAGTGLVWLAALALGDTLGWSQRTLAFFDLAALAGFTMALWLLFGLWRARQNNKE